MIIYRVINLINGKSYIGQTINSLEKRKQHHFYSCRNTKLNIKFYNALRKYGKENFLWGILDYCNDKEELNNKEIFYIEKYDSYRNGYNSNKGFNDTSVTKYKRLLLKWKESVVKNKSFVKRVVSDETKQRMSISAKNKKVSNETRQKISEINKKRPNWVNKKIVNSRKNNGKPWHSDETKNKIGNSNRGKMSHNKGKKMSDIQRQKISDALKIKLDSFTINKILQLYTLNKSIYYISKHTNVSRYIVGRVLKENKKE